MYKFCHPHHHHGPAGLPHQLAPGGGRLLLESCSDLKPTRIHLCQAADAAVCNLLLLRKHSTLGVVLTHLGPRGAQQALFELDNTVQ